MSSISLPSDLPAVPVAVEPHLTVIEPSSGWRLVDFRELYRYRDLLYFLTFRSIRVLYAQSAIGIGWAVLQPLCSMLVFTVVFGRFAGIKSDGVPYAIFSFTALVPWTYFSNALLEASNSLVSQAQMITKVYFPRMILPLAGVCAKLIDFSIAMVMLALAVIMLTSAVGLGMWLTALAIHYRDVKHALNFISQLIMYSTPVVYSATIVPPEWQRLYALNPGHPTNALGLDRHRQSHRTRIATDRYAVFPPPGAAVCRRGVGRRARSEERRGKSEERREELNNVAFRFEQLEIWQRAASIANKLSDIADRLQERRLYRFAEQLRAAALSTPNNIAEGSGSTSAREFVHFLNIARRSAFENASMLVIFAQRGLVSADELNSLLPEMDELCRMITAFARTVARRAKPPRKPQKPATQNSLL
jgi:lipopolysaccharide transport system permease protein